MRPGLPVALVLAVAACGSGADQTPTAAAVVESTTSIEQTTTTTTSSTTTSSTTTTTANATTTGPMLLIRIESGVKIEGPNTISVTQGERVSFEVVTDVADEVHVHGYDLFYDTLPGVPRVVEFVATAAGIFEVELEGTHLDLVNIEVTP